MFTPVISLVPVELVDLCTPCLVAATLHHVSPTLAHVAVFKHLVVRRQISLSVQVQLTHLQETHKSTITQPTATMCIYVCACVRA